MESTERTEQTFWTKGTCLVALILAPFVLLQWLLDSRYEKKHTAASSDNESPDAAANSQNGSSS